MFGCFFPVCFPFLCRWLAEAGDGAPLEGFPERAALLARQLEARKLFRIGIAAALALVPKTNRRGKNGRVAVVTGGNRGLGKALVERLVSGKQFEFVVFSSRVESVISGAVCVRVGDFAEANSVREFGANVLRQFGRVDALVNNAGEMQPNHDETFLEASAEEMARLYAVNTIAPVLLMQLFLPGMEERRSGAIVNVSSGQGAMTEMGALRLPYRCSKVWREIVWRLLFFLLLLSLLLFFFSSLFSSLSPFLNGLQAALNVATLVAAAEHGSCVRINAVCPGFVRTDLTKHLPGPFLEPAEAAEHIVWLLEEDAPTGGFWRHGEGIYW